MSRTDARLAELGIELPPAPPAVASYVPGMLSPDGSTLFISGQVPLEGGKAMAEGSVPAQVSIEEATSLAKRCALNGLAVAKSILNDLDRIEQILRVDGFVASEAGWGGQPGVINGASEVLFEILGERGRHARAAVGVSALPLNVPVEVAMVIAVSP